MFETLGLLQPPFSCRLATARARRGLRSPPALFRRADLIASCVIWRGGGVRRPRARLSAPASRAGHLTNGTICGNSRPSSGRLTDNKVDGARRAVGRPGPFGPGNDLRGQRKISIAGPNQIPPLPESSTETMHSNDHAECPVGLAHHQFGGRSWLSALAITVACSVFPLVSRLPR